MRRLLRIMANLFVTLILFVSLAPVLWVFISSFKSNTEILSNALSLPETWSMKIM